MNVPPSCRSLGFFRAATATLALGVLATACRSSGDVLPATSLQAANDDIPCDAKFVLRTVCQQCHSALPRNSAPFSLVTYADTQVLMGGKPLWMDMRTVVESGLMPLSPVQIGVTERESLLAWLRDGAPPRTASDVCSVFVHPTDANVDAGVDPDAGGPDSLDNPDAEAETAVDSAGADPDGDASGDTDTDGQAEAVSLDGGDGGIASP